MKILIIGSDGFIGNNLADYFYERGDIVFGCGRRAERTSSITYFNVETEYKEWEHIFSANKFDCCINAAGSGKVDHSLLKPLEDFEANTFATIKILEAIRKFNPGCRYLHISSAAVYGNPEILPIKESASCIPVSPYGWHKLMSEQICREYSLLYGMPIAITRPFSIYGPGLKKQLLWDTFQKFKQSPGEIELWGTGNESRDFIFIEDVVMAFDIILKKAPMRAEVYNIASGTETTTKEVVEELFYSLGVKPTIVFNNQTRQGDPLNWKADIAEISKLGFQPAINLRDGIKQTVSWLLKL